MAAAQDYANLAVFYNSNPLIQITSIKIGFASGQQRVELLNEGLGGFTPGSGLVTIEINFVVPIGGTEDTFTEDCVNGTFVTMQIPIGGKDYIGRGKIMTCDISQAVNAVTEGSFTWEGPLKAIA